MGNSRYISYLNIIDHLNVNNGDLILLSSDIVKLICVCRENNEIFNPNKFIDSIINKIGVDGTLILPTYNWDFCNGITFDYNKNISKTGSLSNVALKRNDFTRTLHPIYSHAVHGSASEYLCSVNNISAFGPDSVFAYLHEKNAKQIFIGPTEKFWYTRAYTAIHYIEENNNVKYRFHKYFTAPYINKNGTKNIKTYSMHVRDTNFKDSEGNELASQVNPIISDLLIKKNIYKKYTINGVYIGIIDMYDLKNILENDLSNNGNLIHFIPNYLRR